MSIGRCRNSTRRSQKQLKKVCSLFCSKWRWRDPFAATGQIMANLEEAVTTAISRKVILPLWLSGKKSREERTI